MTVRKRLYFEQKSAVFTALFPSNNFYLTLRLHPQF